MLIPPKTSAFNEWPFYNLWKTHNARKELIYFHYFGTFEKTGPANWPSDGRTDPSWKTERKAQRKIFHYWDGVGPHRRRWSSVQNRLPGAENATGFLSLLSFFYYDSHFKYSRRMNQIDQKPSSTCRMSSGITANTVRPRFVPVTPPVDRKRSMRHLKASVPELYGGLWHSGCRQRARKLRRGSYFLNWSQPKSVPFL